MKKLSNTYVTAVNQNQEEVHVCVNVETISKKAVHNISIDQVLEEFTNNDKKNKIDGIMRQLKSYMRHRIDIETAIQILKDTSSQCKGCTYLTELQYMAISMFIKCFQSNAKDTTRVKLNENKIYNKDFVNKKFFESISELRNKHIMHDEDYMHNSVCVAEYDGSSVEIIKTLNCERIPLDENKIKEIILLMEKALNWCENKYDEIGKQIKEELEELFNCMGINCVLRYELKNNSKESQLGKIL